MDKNRIIVQRFCAGSACGIFKASFRGYGNFCIFPPDGILDFLGIRWG
jgi:hypothetical protein